MDGKAREPVPQVVERGCKDAPDAHAQEAVPVCEQHIALEPRHGQAAEARAVERADALEGGASKIRAADAVVALIDDEPDDRRDAEQATDEHGGRHGFAAAFCHRHAQARDMRHLRGGKGFPIRDEAHREGQNGRARRPQVADPKGVPGEPLRGEGHAEIDEAAFDDDAGHADKEDEHGK